MIDRRRKTTLAPGLRNNNPGNILLTNIPWAGKVPNHKNTSGIHEQFVNSAFGWRALMKQIKTTANRAGTDPYMFVKDYAGGANNNVLTNYANHLTARIPGGKIGTTGAALRSTAKAISEFENGPDHNYFKDSEVMAGYKLLTGSGEMNQQTKIPLPLIGILSLLAFS